MKIKSLLFVAILSMAVLSLGSQVFAITAVPVAKPSVTIISPNGGESWKIGTAQTVKFSTSNIGLAGTCVDAFAVNTSNGSKTPLSLGSYISIAKGVLKFNLGSGSSANITRGIYRVEVDAHYCAETNNAFIASGSSVGIFEITALTTPTTPTAPITPTTPTVQQSLKLTSPIGGEQWKIGETYDVSWTSQGLSDPIIVSVALLNVTDNTSVVFARSPVNNGRHAWTIASAIGGQAISSNKQYKIKISVEGNPTVSSTGNEFSITASTAVCAPKWDCTAWTACSNGQQTKACVDINNCGVTTNKPPVSEACVCAPKWDCTAWTACSNGQQTKACVDVNNCGVTTNKPPVSQACSGTGSADLLGGLQNWIASLFGK